MFLVSGLRYNVEFRWLPAFYRCWRHWLRNGGQLGTARCQVGDIHLVLIGYDTDLGGPITGRPPATNQ